MSTPRELAPGTRIRIAVADDDAALRDALHTMMDSEDWLEWVGDAADSNQAISLCLARQPDVILVDMKMPGGGGPRAVSEIAKVSKRTRCISLSAFDDRPSVLQMLRAGALAYVVKGAPVEEVLATIVQVFLGQSTLSPTVARTVVHELAGQLEKEETEARARREKRERLRNGLATGKLGVVYQPVVRLSDGRTVGYESLARFADPGHESPKEWFDDAREVGLTAELEFASVRQALASLGDVPVETWLSVNLSPASILIPEFEHLISHQLAKRLVIEITEHAPVDDYGDLAVALQGFRAAGGRVAVDDVGAGYSSLHHILELGPDFIKLDVVLARDIETDAKRRALASCLAVFAQSLGITAIAEGVETAGQLQGLSALGIQHGQGYFLARPGPIPSAPRVVVPLLRKPKRDTAPTTDPVTGEGKSMRDGGINDPDFRLLAEAVPHIAWTARPDGFTDYFNGLGTRYTGLAREAFCDWNWVSLVHPDDADRARGGWEHAVRMETPFRLDYRLRGGDGVYRWHAFRAQAVRGAGGEIVKWIGTATDIDDQKSLEADLRDAQREALEYRNLLLAAQPATITGFGSRLLDLKTASRS
jgi:PAS domain S-box-containing protein